ncbi:MAG: hypothetical protein AAGI30_11075 [Planctomycetota bacterium]
MKSSTKAASPTADGASENAKGPAAPRFRRVFGEQSNAGAEAAKKLAALAGLQPVAARSASATETPKYRKLKKSPLGKKELDHFREVLRAKRSEILGDVTTFETEALASGGGGLSHMPQHIAEQGSDTADQSLNLNLAAGGRRLLREIEDALGRIEEGTFGICELLGKPIKKERLENTPWARYSIEAARMIEENPHLLRANADDTEDAGDDDDDDDA